MMGLDTWLARITRITAAATCAFFPLVHCVHAAEPPLHEFNISPQSLRLALGEFARQSGQELLFAPEVAVEKRTEGVRGTFTPLDALQRILAGTGLTFDTTPSKAILIRPLEMTPARAGADGKASGWTAAGGEPRHYRLAMAEDAAGSGASNDAAQTESIPGSTGNARAEVVLDEVTVIGIRSKFRVNTSAAATKIEMPLKDTPQSMTILSDELLRAAAIKTTADLGDYAPGLQEAGRGDGTEAILTSRGFDVVRDRGYKINGLAVDAEIDIDYAAVERVEVVRGPASVLYAEVDYGATINRVLKRPTRQFQALSSLELGSFDRRRVDVDIGGPLGAGERVGGRVVLAYEDTDDSVDYVHRRNKMFAPTLSLQLNETGNLTAHGYYQKVDGRHSDGFGVFPDGSLPDTPRDSFLGTNLNKIDTKNSFINLNYDQRMGAGWKLGVRTAFSKVEMRNFAPFVGSNIFSAGEGAPLDDNDVPVERIEFDGRAPLTASHEIKDTENLSLDVTLSKSFQMFGQEHTIALSADYREAKHFQQGSDFIGIGVVNLFEGRPLIVDPADVAALVNPAFAYDEKQELSGVSLLALIKPTARLHLLAGVRNTGSDTITLYAGEKARSDLSDTLGRLGVVYQLSDTWSTYASWSEGIIFNAFFYDENFEPVRPEHGEQLEFGIKADLFGERASFAAAVFRLKRKDSLAYLSTNPDPPFNDIYGNVGRQNHEGLEVELLGEIVPGLNVLASYQYLDVEVLAAEDPAAVGHWPPNAPRHSASAYLTYAFQNTLPNLAIGGGLVYRSEREVDNVGTLALPSFTRFDLRASYDVSESLVAEVIAKNITDEKILASSYGSANFGIIYPDPRSYALRMTYKFQ